MALTVWPTMAPRVFVVTTVTPVTAAFRAFWKARVSVMSVAQWTRRVQTGGRPPVNAWQPRCVSRIALRRGGTSAARPTRSRRRRRRGAAARRAQAARAARPAGAGGRADGRGGPARRRPVGRGRARVGGQDGPHPRLGAAQGAAAGRAAHARRRATRSSCRSEALDLDRFERLRREGRAALDAGDAAKASARFEAALELWRGPALAEFAEPFALVEAAHLRERLQVCVEDRIDADLALGRHADLVGELESLVVVEPAARAPARAADGRAVPLRAPGRRAGRLPRLPRHARRPSSGWSRRRGCASSSGGSCARTSTLDGRAETSAEVELKMEPIRYVQSVGGYSIAYQVIGDGPLDIVFVHGFICSFQPGWEWPALASFYRRLAGMGRLILFDKRGTGLSDRVLGIASLEERMDDVRAVMDAVGAERAVVVGVSRGRADVHAVRRHPPGPLPGADHPRRLRAPQLGARLPDRPPRRAGRLAAPDRRAVGPLRHRALPRRAGAVDRRRRGGDRAGTRPTSCAARRPPPWRRSPT